MSEKINLLRAIMISPCPLVCIALRSLKRCHFIELIPYHIIKPREACTFIKKLYSEGGDRDDKTIKSKSHP